MLTTSVNDIGTTIPIIPFSNLNPHLEVTMYYAVRRGNIIDPIEKTIQDGVG